MHDESHWYLSQYEDQHLIMFDHVGKVQIKCACFIFTCLLLSRLLGRSPGSVLLSWSMILIRAEMLCFVVSCNDSTGLLISLICSLFHTIMFFSIANTVMLCLSLLSTVVMLFAPFSEQSAMVRPFELYFVEHSLRWLSI